MLNTLIEAQDDNNKALVGMHWQNACIFVACEILTLQMDVVHDCTHGVTHKGKGGGIVDGWIDGWIDR